MNDPATPAFKQADIADKQAFYDANAEKVTERNKKEDPMPQLLAMEEYAALCSSGQFAIYSAALSATKNPGDAAQAKALFAKADQDPGLKDVVPKLDAAREQITGVKARQEVQAAPSVPASILPIHLMPWFLDAQKLKLRSLLLLAILSLSPEQRLATKQPAL